MSRHLLKGFLRVRHGTGGWITLRSVGGIGGAAAISQLIALFAAPVLARIYPTSAFGQFGAIVAYSNILATVLLFGLSDAILAAKSRPDATRLAAGAIQILGIALAPVGLFTWIAIDRGWFGLGILPVGTSILIIALVAMLVLGSLLQCIMVRRKYFRALGQSYLTLGVVRSGTQLGLTLTTISFLGLASGELAGRVAANWVMARRLRVRLLRSWAMLPRFWVPTLKAYRRFPIQRTPSAVLSALAVGAPVLMITSQYGEGAAGQFSLMFTLLMGPLTIIQRAIGDVFTGTFGDLYWKDRSGAVHLASRFAISTFTLGALATATLLFVGKGLFIAFLGDQWRLAGEMSVVIAPLAGIMVAILPLSQILMVTHRPDLKLYFDLCYVGGLIFLLYQATKSGFEVLTFVSWFSGIATLAYSLLIPLILWSLFHPRNPLAT